MIRTILACIQLFWSGPHKGAFSENIFLLRFPTKTSTGQFDQEFSVDHFYTHIEALGWSNKASDPV